MKWDEQVDAAANARRELPGMVSSYFARVREFLSADFEPRELHRLRLESKRLRYTLELFRPCYPAGLEERLDALKKLQDLLGEINDAAASSDLFRERLRRQPKVRKYLEDRAAGLAAEFVQHWKQIFDAPGKEAWWTDFLAKKARAPRVIEE